MDFAVRCNRVLSHLENAILGVGVAAMLFIMVVVSLDAALRYVVNSPIEWSYDLISLYGLVLIGYLPMSATFRDGGHVSVPLFFDLFPVGLQKSIRLLVTILTLVLCAGLLALAFDSTVKAHQTNEVRLGIVMFAVWLSYLPITCGFALIVARLLFSFFLLISFGKDPFVIQDGEVTE